MSTVGAAWENAEGAALEVGARTGFRTGLTPLEVETERARVLAPEREDAGSVATLACRARPLGVLASSSSSVMEST